MSNLNISQKNNIQSQIAFEMFKEILGGMTIWQRIKLLPEITKVIK